MFTGNEDQSISLSSAVDKTAAAQEKMSSSDIKGGYISKASLNAVLHQENCVGIRIYYAKDRDSGDPTIVISGVLADESDIASEGDILLDGWIPCPPRCDTASPLMS